MRKSIISILFATAILLLCATNSYSQGVSINNDGTSPDGSAMLDVKSTNTGILVPRMTQVQRNAIVSPATGLMVFQTDNTPGFYFNSGTTGSPVWTKLLVPVDNTTYIAGNQLGLSGTTFNVSEGPGSDLDADLLDGQHYSDIQTWVNANDDNTTYTAGTGLTLTGTEFTPTFGTAVGTVSQGNHTHDASHIISGEFNRLRIRRMYSADTRATNPDPDTYEAALQADFKNNTADGLTGDGGTYHGVLSFRPYGGGADYSGGPMHQLGFSQAGNLWMRSSSGASSWGSWKRILSSSSSGTTNYVSKFTSSTALGNSQIFDNGTNIGIGTATPGAPFHMYQDRYTLYGPNSTWGAYLQVGGNGRVATIASVAATNGNLHLDAADGGYATYINYYSANNTYINANAGNVGVGTTAPTRKLHVNGMIRAEGIHGLYLDDYYLRDHLNGNVTLSGQGGDLYLGYQYTSNLRFYSGNTTGLATQKMILLANGNFGIGTNSPSYKLHVPSGYIGTDYINTTDNAVTSGVTGIMVKSGDNFHRTANAAAVLSFLGVTAPTGDNLGNHTATTTLNMNTQAITNFTKLTPYGVGGNSGMGNEAYSIFQEGGAWTNPYPDLRIAFHTGIKLGANSGYGGIRFYSDYDMATLVMSVNDAVSGAGANNVYMAGNLGIGTTSPSYKLHVAGDVYANGGWLRSSGSTGWYNETYGGGWYMTDATWIRTYNGKSIYQNTGIMRTDGTLQVGSSGATLNVPNGGNLAYRTSVLFANTAGNVGIGTTTPGQKLQVNGKIASVAASTYMYQSNVGSYGSASGYAFNQTGVIIESGFSESGGFQANGNNANIWSPGDADILRIYDEDGMVLKTYFDFNGTYYNPSDINKKQNIVKIDNALAKIQSINGYNFEFKLHKEEIEKGQTPKTTSGVIAQEVDLVMPEIVDHHDEDGLYVNYEGLIPYLIEAVKEQQEIIDDLQKRIEELENKSQE